MSTAGLPSAAPVPPLFFYSLLVLSRRRFGKPIQTYRRYLRLIDRKSSVWFHALEVNIPVAVSVFPGELYQAPRSWAEKAFPKLIHFNNVERGGHFAAWEQPLLFSEEVRAGFRSFRK